MTKKTRDWLFGIFVFLFVIITITLSLYATGYRLNLTWPLRLNKVLVKTGTLTLNTTPEGATVLINSENKINSIFPLINSQKILFTPVKIKNLLPGNYVVSFNLTGYWPYEKELRVIPEQTTFLEDVILFKKSVPLNIFKTKIQDISYSVNGTYAWLKDEAEIVNIKTGLSTTKINLKKINWVNGGKQILEGSKLLNLETGNIQDYKNLIGEVEEAQLSDNGDFMVYLTNNNLAALDIISKSTTLIPASGLILNYGISGNILLITVSFPEKTELKSFNLKSKIFLSSSELLTSKNFSLNQDNPKNPILVDNEHKIIYLLQANGQNPLIKNIIRGVSVFKWLDGNKLAYTLESEIYIYDLTQNKSNLVTRLSEKINSLSWSTNNFLIYATKNVIGTINLVNNGNDVMILWQGNNISSLHFDEKTGVIYFLDLIDKQSGLYKMSLR